MSDEELARFQTAVAQLHKQRPGSVWETFRDLYMHHIMHANKAPYFLPWHRAFLRQVQQSSV